uniref:Uncharacterized protein n=1 Tax=Meloidogyne incognita TaxID=6306 RepID=A0A914M575_MELIC
MCSDLMRRRRSRLARSCRRYRERRTPSLTAKYTNWSTGRKHPIFRVLVFMCTKSGFPGNAYHQ